MKRCAHLVFKGDQLLNGKIRCAECRKFWGFMEDKEAGQ